jgi:transposase InsO family protein
MPWKQIDMLTLRQEFIALARQDGANVSQLCQRFEISRKTGYKWLQRAEQEGATGLLDRSRRPAQSPKRTGEVIEELVMQLRAQHPRWGARKLCRRLQDLGHADIPTPSTINRILQRHGLISEHASQASQPWTRFEHAQPNDLWQMDFKGYFQTVAATCHPLTVIDDHSRYNIVLHACNRPNGEQVQRALVAAFHRYGMPVRINVDNGSPWGSPKQHEHGITAFTIWLIRLGIRVSHSRPAHPQTNGKDERFHRSLKAEVLHNKHFATLAEVQGAFDAWRQVYNHERPHQALGLSTPDKRYQPSALAYPACLPEIVYAEGDIVQTVGCNGGIVVQGKRFKVSSALRGHPIAARAVAQTDGLYDLYYCHQRFAQIDLRNPIRQD